MINYQSVEERWQKAWREAKIFEPGVSPRPSYMVTAAFPYTNGPQHLGHLRTYCTADVLARYKRMKGFNVLFPMGFHLTGTPLLAQANKLKEKNTELIADFKSFGISDEEIEKMKDPLYMGLYFAKEIRSGMEKAGYSIDWTRSFTSIDPQFSKMIEWQFGVLNRLGYLVQGRHPVGWCPRENNAVGMHDTKGDVEPEIEKEIAVAFKVDGQDYSILCTTFRPETLEGVTNLFVNENEAYVKCKMGGSQTLYCISKASVDQVGYQLGLQVVGEISGKELSGKSCRNPFNGVALPIFPGYFVKPDVGTGAVMSVPAHAPFDYVALMKLKKSGYNVGEIKPIIVLEIPGKQKTSSAPASLDIPALAYLEAVKADINAEDKLIESATKLQYKEESHKGKMLTKGFEGMSEPEAREKMSKQLIDSKDAIELYVLVNEEPVLCRCMTRIVVKVVDNQWFINYGDKEWKEIARKALANVRIIPEKSKPAFSSALEWINLRAVARAQGLGTHFPLDKNYLIESLSDSTMYMTLYTIQNLLKGVEPERLTPEFFEYVYLGKGDLQEISGRTGVDSELLKRCREAFSYWYADTSRHSSLELIFNHYTMYIFNHAAIFPKENWPKQIVANGVVMMEGEKMSKSLGNIIMLSDGIKRFGADPLRFVIVASTDLFNDSNFAEDSVRGTQERFEYLYKVCSDLDGMEAGELSQIDYWLYSKINRKISYVTEAMEKLELRDISTELLYNTVLELKHYFLRGGKNSLAVREYISQLILMLQPVVPHLAEELWHLIGNSSFVSIERWPEADPSMLSDQVESQEEFVENALNDSKQIAALMGKKSEKRAREITLIVASQWKHDLLESLSKSRSMEKALATIADKKEPGKEAAAKYLGGYMKRVNELKVPGLSSDEELSALKGAIPYLSQMLGCNVKVEPENESKSERATRASPSKPSIDLVY